MPPAKKAAPAAKKAAAPAKRATPVKKAAATAKKAAASAKRVTPVKKAAAVRKTAPKKASFAALPPRERAVIEQSQSEKYPEEYGAQVEQYLLNLANESSAKK